MREVILAVQERVHWIDITRGIAIIAIVLGHVFTSGNLWRYVFSFHVPIFFFISGYCFSYKKDMNLFLKEKTDKIVIPYLVFSSLSICAFFLASLVLPQIKEILDCNLGKNLRCMFYGTSKPAIMKYNQPLWFLPCYFCVSIIAYIVERIGGWTKHRNIIRIVAVVIGILTGIFFKHHENISLPWHLETAFSMLVWFEFGNLTRECDLLRLFSSSKLKTLFLAAFCLILGIVFELLNVRTVGVRNEHYGIIWIYYLSAASTIIGICLISVLKRESRIVEYLGRNTLIILVLHKFPIVLFQEILGVTRNAMNSNNGVVVYVCGILITTVSIGLSLLIGKMIERVFPWMVGIRRKI